MKQKPIIVCDYTPEELNDGFQVVYARTYIDQLRRQGHTYEEIDAGFKYCQELRKQKQGASLKAIL